MVNTVKLSEIRERTVEELSQDIVNLRKKLFELRLAKTMQKLENTAEIAKAKDLIAKCKTVIREKQLQK